MPVLRSCLAVALGGRALFAVFFHDPYGQRFFDQMNSDRDSSVIQSKVRFPVDLFANPILSNKSHSGLCFTDSWRRLLLVSKERRNRSCAAHTAQAHSRELPHTRPVSWLFIRGDRLVYLQRFVSPTLVARSDWPAPNLCFSTIYCCRVVCSRMRLNL